MEEDISHTNADGVKSVERSPIVVMMGHVDHGKSSLLEAIREEFKITSKESGGITQHIGAYEVNHQGKTITFLDTPGHEIFSAMRSRGAKVADIAILVVAADEGVKPQTKEAIAQIQRAEIPMIVAINKIDRPEANPDRVMLELSQNGVMVESFGGNVPSVVTSATTKRGINELLDMVLLVAEVVQLKADPSLSGRGVVIESYVDSKRGAGATLLVTDGTIRAGDILGTRTCFGKIRIMEDFQGARLREAGPAKPVIALGFGGYPYVGDEFRTFETEDAARAFVGQQKEEKKQIAKQVSLAKQSIAIILKTDVLGSLEAVEQMLEALPQEEVALKIIQTGVGEVNENDVKLAQGTGARVFSFRAKVQGAAKNFAEREDIPLESFDVIYDLIQRVRVLLEKAVKMGMVKTEIGALSVLEVFFTDKGRQIVGGKVMEGEVRKGSKIEIFRGENKIGEGRMLNLQRSKKDVTLVAKGEECGILCEGSVRIQEGDVLRFFVEEMQKI